MPRYKSIVQAARTAFADYTALSNLKVQGPDSVGNDDNVRGEMKWCADNMDSLIDVYGHHDYAQGGTWYSQNESGQWTTATGFPTETADADWSSSARYPNVLFRFKAYNNWYTNQTTKPVVIGELGARQSYTTDDSTYARDVDPDRDTAVVGVVLAEKAIAAFNAGYSAFCFWALNDDKQYYGSTYLYSNSYGLFKTSSDNFAPRSKLYAQGLITRYFRGNSKLLSVSSSDSLVRAAAIKSNDDSKYALLAVNRYSTEKSVTFNLSGVTKVRRYLYDPASPPSNSQGDLQASDKTITLTSGSFTDTLPANAMAVYTDEFDEVAPASVSGVSRRIKDQTINVSWDASSASDLAYYRIYRSTSATFTPSSSNQIASTVATSYVDTVTGTTSTYFYRITAVDIYGNESAQGSTGAVTGNGTGLKGEYHLGSAFNTLIKTQTDPQIDFEWAGTPTDLSGAAMSSMPSDGFSVRWTGQVQAVESGTYTFSALADDGVKVWIGNLAAAPLINQASASATPATADISLTAGQKYNIKIEFREDTSNAKIRLSWKRPGQSTAVVIPQSQLFDTLNSGTAKYYDFNADSTATAQGYTGVAVQAYSTANGYGWQSTVDVLARNRFTGSDLQRDFHQSSAAKIFLVDVPNGSYNVRVYTGDASYAHDNLNVSAEGVQKVSGVSTAANAFTSREFAVTVSDGQLTLQFSDGGGTDSNWVCNGIDIVAQ